ncbi:armadillo-type protein [Penicillium digitatum]|nr:armadillo-type protein [Penicillium digitatum]
MSREKMPLRADEEMGKKDDDHRPSDQARFLPRQHRAMPRPRRIFFAIFVLVLVYEFFKHMPTDLPPAADRFDPTIARLREETITRLGGSVKPHSFPKPDAMLSDNLPPAKVLESNRKVETYDGMIKFYELAQSLPPYKYSQMASSRAVLFAASSLHSVSDLLPLACRMASQQLNYVHFTLMGKEEISIEGVKEVNGIRENECPMTWHDARPDYAPISTDDRMKRSVIGGLQNIQTYISPEVTITQGQRWEDIFFWDGIEAYSRENGIPHVALSAASRDLMWIASLDSKSLRSWNKIQIEMVVHAPSESSGSLIRLIKSLDAADFLGSAPSLTIELPQRVDPQLLQFLQRLGGLNQLSGRITIRRRIQPHDMNTVESSIRTVESFYPRDPEVTHLLLLSPQTELAPSFYHYLKFAVLNYKQSSRAKRVFSNMIGISLELPSSKPTTDSQSFTPPPMTVEGKEQFLPSFLWQSPNSNAALYFGDAWAEFHSFMAQRLSTLQSENSQTKILSERFPAFMEHMLEMIRAKGYYLLYPSFPGIKFSSIATVHTELYQPPEEFGNSNPSTSVEEATQVSRDPTQPLAGGISTGLGSVGRPLNRASTIMPLLDLFSSGLPDLDDLPLLSYDGEGLTAEAYTKQTEQYARQFRTHFGGCARDGEIVETSTDPLFCIQV